MKFKNNILKVLTAREKLFMDRKGWAKFTYAVECVFAAFSPLTKNFLIATKHAQSVMPFNRV